MLALLILLLTPGDLVELVADVLLHEGWEEDLDAGAMAHQDGVEFEVDYHIYFEDGGAVGALLQDALRAV